MPGVAPIKLGSAAGSFMFESGSSVSTSDSGIQTCSVKALYPNGSAVFSALPSAGVSFSTVFGNAYLPSTFLLDYTAGGPAIDYLDGTIARVTFLFKRVDPLSVGIRQVFTDSIINYKSFLSPYLNYQITATGEAQDGIFGFPEPVCTVKYSTSTQPGIGSGDLSSIYALPGSSKAQGFPAVPDISVPISFVAGIGSVVTYFNGTTFVSVGPLTVQTTFNFSANFTGNPRGWQLIQLKADPVAARSFWDVEERWRNFYLFTGVTFINTIPHL